MVLVTHMYVIIDERATELIAKLSHVPSYLVLALHTHARVNTQALSKAALKLFINSIYGLEPL